MRVARFTTGEDPRYGVVEGSGDEAFVAVVAGDPLYSGFELTGERHALDEVRLLAPVIPRSKIVGIGRNYAAHASELGNDVSELPLAFFKPNTSVIGPGDPIQYPKQSTDLHYEAELAVVVGRMCRDLVARRVPDVIYGYTCANDVTARDLQRSDGQWARAKGFDTFCPLGPWIETDLDPSDVGVRATLNGDVMQDGRTLDMIHDVPALLCYVTSFTTLLPGDVVLTGTPAGVGPMRPGDTVSVSVEGIGDLTNPVAARA